MGCYRSHVFFSKNVPRDLAADLSRRLNVQHTEDIGRYLGVHMIHHRKSKAHFDFILDKMHKKLSGWKSNSLSLADQVTLAQA